jgi:hypothetical protein
VTFSNVFVNGNYEDFLQRVQYQHQRTNLTTIGCMPQNPFRVPRNLVNMPGNMEFIDGLVQCLIEDVGACPLFVAAGPASSIIIHRYWMRAKRRRTILDIGSALDLTCGRATRGYHNYDHPNRTKMCRWSNVL